MAGKEKRSTPLDFTLDLNHRVSNGKVNENALDDLVQEVRRHIDVLLKSSRNKQEEGAEVQGTHLWNNCNRLKRDISSQNGTSPWHKFALVGRFLAFLLLTSGWKENAAASKTFRVMGLAIKTGKSCLEQCEFELATEALSRAAMCNKQLEALQPSFDDDEDKRECQSLAAEYFIVRTALSHKTNRLEVAEHMYNKSTSFLQTFSPDDTARLADVLLDLGKSLLEKSDLQLAVKWLERASDIINVHNLEQLREAAELRQAISQALVTALLNFPEGQGLEKAEKILSHMESEMGNQFLVCLLRLELIEKHPAEAFDDVGYASVLRCMIKQFQYTESTFELLCRQIRKLQEKSPGLACQVLDEFLHMMNGSEKHEWTEKLVIVRVWMSIKQRDLPETIHAVEKMLSKLKNTLRPEVTTAIQKALSVKLEKSFQERQFDLAEKWCRLALHPALRNSGPTNLVKLERKLLLCSIMRNDVDCAMSIVQEMPENTQKDPLTAYLLFKVALLSKNNQLAGNCLKVISSAPNHMHYLSACVADSQKSGNAECAVAAMQQLIERYEYDKTSNPVHLPALFRCIIRLLHDLVNNEKDPMAREALIKETCEVLGELLRAVERDPRDANNGKLFNVEELNFLSRTAYNMGMENSGAWNPRFTVQVLTVTAELIGYYPKDIDSALAGDVALREMFARFVAGAALISLARCEDKVDQQLQDYTEARKHIAAFDDLLMSRLGDLQGGERDDMMGKLATMLCFEFEAAICLKEWDDLGKAVRKVKECQSSKALQAMADCLLRSDGVSGEVLFSVMRLIVNEIWELEQFDKVKLAKYLRCLFQACLLLDEARAFDVLQETLEKARESELPRDEMEWMASTSYNHGVDCYMSNRDDDARKWIEKAMSLAHLCPDNGALANNMREKYLSLKLDGPRLDGSAQ